jgi:serine/threonine-protein kinase
MTDIKLNRAAWKFDESKPLGSAGGFGAVFRGEAADGSSVAVKRLHISAGDAAHRELRVAEDLVAASHQHVIPVLDAGQDAHSDRYFIVMPVASGSLEDHVRSQGKLTESEAVDVLLQIATGLREVGDLVHRDLKPANVLKHEGVWKIADFGIARFVSDSTSVNTLKDCLSPHYAAPEQWRMERSTPATDVYALGCIAFKCLNGTSPFNGDIDQIREQHLNGSLPSINVSDPKLKSLVVNMLRKSPSSRPSISRVISQLENIMSTGGAAPIGGAWNALEKAGAAIAEAEAAAEAERERVLSESQQRSALYQQALVTLWNLADDLFDRITRSAPTAEKRLRGKLVLGKGTIEISELRQNLIAANQFPHCGWDVICGAVISVTQTHPKYVWSSSLWYAKKHPADEYRWREVSYYAPFSSQRRFEPHHLEDLMDADIAMSQIMHSFAVAWGPKSIDDEDAEDFYNRWAKWLALASQGNLSRPTSLPLK